MLKKHFVGAMAAASLLIVPVNKAQANDFVGGLVGGLIGGAVGSGLANQQRQRTTTTRTRTVYVNPAATAQRQENRQVQTSLNYFGFNAGGADGVLGSRSRAAISSYQAYLSFPATGQLTPMEKSILLAAYQRGLAGGADATRLIAQSPDGARALLQDQRKLATGQAGARTASYAGLPELVSRAVDEVAQASDPSAEQLLQRAGFLQLADLNGDGTNDYIIDTALAGSAFWCNGTACKTMVFASSSNGYVRQDMFMVKPQPAMLDCIGINCRVRDTAAPEANAPMMAATPPPQAAPQVVEAAAPQQAAAGLALPVFNTAPKAKSLASFCGKVTLLTTANGGFTTVADQGDPTVTLGEQFCVARTYAMAEGDKLMAAVQGATPDQIAEQCETFGQGFEAHVAALGSKPAEAILKDVSSVVLSSGMTLEQLRTTARICMASGYQNDRARTALGGAVLLTALGERPVAELVAHHLYGGFGTDKNEDSALGWYDMAVTALDEGATPVFAPEQADRTALLKSATMALSGETVTAPVTSTSAAMPVFNIAQ